jgi:hypothetical protein
MKLKSSIYDAAGIIFLLASGVALPFLGENLSQTLLLFAIYFKASAAYVASRERP